MFSNWHRALSLEERAELLNSGAIEPEAPSTEANGSAGASALDRWQSETNLLDPRLFSSRCKSAGLNRDQWQRLLEDKNDFDLEGLASPPVWAKRIASAFDTSPREGAEVSELPLVHQVPLLRWVVPLVAQAKARLKANLDALLADRSREAGKDQVFVDPSIVEPLTAQILEETQFLISRTLVLELNILRHLDQLEGDSPEARFSDFAAKLEQADYAASVANQYPTLARCIDLRTEQWVETSTELLARLLDDQPLLEDTFASEGPLGAVSEVQLGLGDRHENGRAVCIVGFSSGQKVVYKPRSVGTEAAYFELIRWLEETGFPIELAAMRTLERDDYGWVEFAHKGPCKNSDELDRFFERIGAYVALTYALEATDMHYENIIASGEHPVLIDLETLFQPLVGDPQPHVSQPRESIDNVLRSGLLPRRFWADEASAGIDLSGMSVGNNDPVAVEQLKAAGSDEARYEDALTQPEQKSNLPTDDPKSIDLSAAEPQVVAGFVKMYRHLEAHRDELLAAEGPLYAFRELPIRVIVRATDVYSRLLRASFHPDYLQNGLDRDRLFDKLWLDASHIPDFERTAEYEARALQRVDVPRFSARPSSRSLVTDEGQVLEDFFLRPAWELVEQRLAALGDDDLKSQTWLVRASLHATRYHGESSLPAVEEPAAKPRSEDLPEELAATEARPIGLERDQAVETSLALAHHLLDLAVHKGPWINWFHVVPGNQIPWTLQQTGPTFYDGLSGIALFLAQAGRVSATPELTDLARKTLGNARDWYSEGSPFKPKGPGAYEGWAGWIYTLGYLGALWTDQALVQEAVDATDRLSELVPQDEFYDVIGGSAGCLGVLLSLETVVQESLRGESRQRALDKVRAAATLCATHLCEHAVEQGNQAWWPSPGGQFDHPLSGFAHGASGIAWALLRFGLRHDDQQSLELAKKAIAFEQQSFHPEQQAWLDLRANHADPSTPASFPFAWCHGAPGIGLARAEMLRALEESDATPGQTPEQLKDPAWRQQLHDELAAATRLTLEHGLSQGQSLCHGTLGNLDLLLIAAEFSQEPSSTQQEGQPMRGPASQVELKDLPSLAQRCAVQTEQQLRKGEYLCGLNLPIEQPGLLLGLAGLGYGLLRLTDPLQVPSVLSLDCPKWQAERNK